MFEIVCDTCLHDELTDLPVAPEEGCPVCGCGHWLGPFMLEGRVKTVRGGSTRFVRNDDWSHEEEPPPRGLSALFD